VRALVAALVSVVTWGIVLFLAVPFVFFGILLLKRRQR